MSDRVHGNEVVLRLDNVTRSFAQGTAKINVLRGVDLTLHAGEIVGLIGPSGSGKSTLLQATGLLEGGFGGEITISGTACSRLKEAPRTVLRGEAIGFIYQFHHLLPDFSALENAAMPLILKGKSRTQSHEQAHALLDRLGLAERLSHRPAKLSGGEQQRVAIARALVHRPKLLLADEPTGNLDQATANVVLDELVNLARDHQVGALIATHNLGLAHRLDRVVALKDGRLHPLADVVA
ncbi:MAG: ABC transporter ATP-binding protein [Pseudomonadota bacterium]